MKKFIFTLQALLDVNISLEKEQKNQLAMVNNRIQALHMQSELIESEIRINSNAYMVLIEGMLNIDQIKNQNSYIKYLNNEIHILDKKIETENKEKEKVQRLLVETVMKRKSLEKLMEKQYKKYLENVRVENEKIIEDFTSHHVSSLMDDVHNVRNIDIF